MIPVSKQLKFLFIPVANTYILICHFFLNARFMKSGWRWKSYLCLFPAAIASAMFAFAVAEWLYGTSGNAFVSYCLFSFPIGAVSLWLQSRFLIE